MADAPISCWLHQGPNSQATVCVSFVGTHKQFALTRGQLRELRARLEEAERLLERDDSEIQFRKSIKLGGVHA
jgi:hypothetical protein